MKLLPAMNCGRMGCRARPAGQAVQPTPFAALPAAQPRSWVRMQMLGSTGACLPML